MVTLPGSTPLRRYEFKQAKSKGAVGAKLLFKKRMFRETDETVTEPQFVNLSYIQAQHDYLQVRGWLAAGRCICDRPCLLQRRVQPQGISCCPLCSGALACDSLC